MSEVIALDVNAARRLTERIRLIAQNVADNVEKLRELVAEAKDSNAHVALGYASWTAYLQDVFGDEPLRLASDVRQELVAELAVQKMSTRAIATIVGVDHSTVVRDLSGGANAPREVAGLDGKSYSAPERKQPVKPSAEVTLINDIRLYLRAMARSPQIARLSDAGKQHLINALQDTTQGMSTRAIAPIVDYSTPKRVVQRRALTDSAQDAGFDLRKAVERITRIREDDRFSRNKTELAVILRGQLLYTVETCTRLLDEI